MRPVGNRAMVRGRNATEGASVQRMTDVVATIATAAANAGPHGSAAANVAVDAAAAWQALHAATRAAVTEAFTLALAIPSHEPAWETFKTLHDRLVVALEQSDEAADFVSLFYAEPPAGAA